MFAVENVGRSDVNGIDLLPFKRGFQIIVGISLYAIALAQFAVLFTISSDDRCQLGIFSVFKRRQHGRLRDVPQPDNGIANFLIPHVPSLRSLIDFAPASGRARIALYCVRQLMMAPRAKSVSISKAAVSVKDWEIIADNLIVNADEILTAGVELQSVI